jgi:hypothetical protein
MVDILFLNKLRLSMIAFFTRNVNQALPWIVLEEDIASIFTYTLKMEAVCTFQTPGTTY